VLESGFAFDLIDAHYFYPDGVAAVLLGRHFGRPVTITARGTDINLIPHYALPRRLIQWAAQRAQGLAAVCQALKDEMVGLGVPAERIRVLRNGVDLALFAPGDRAAARRRLNVAGPVIASVGHLIARKGHDLVISAMAGLPDATLLIAGDGPERAALQALAERAGIAGRVRFLGRVGHEELPEVYRAADVLVLASSREGWANVLLEAMACGTPVVASNVWGTPEVVAAPEAGRLLPERSAAAIAACVRAVLSDPPSRAATRAYAERFGWEPTTQGQITLFGELLAMRGGGAGA
jgi:glycosyltransferase involved in cell wall biosynthesis